VGAWSSWVASNDTGIDKGWKTNRIITLKRKQYKNYSYSIRIEMARDLISFPSPLSLT